MFATRASRPARHAHQSTRPRLGRGPRVALVASVLGGVVAAIVSAVSTASAAPTVLASAAVPPHTFACWVEGKGTPTTNDDETLCGDSTLAPADAYGLTTMAPQDFGVPGQNVDGERVRDGAGVATWVASERQWVFCPTGWTDEQCGA